MIRTRYVLLALALVSTAAAAQRKTRGEKEADWGSVMSGSTIGLRLSTGDVENMDPVKRLVDKRKDLKLTDDQQKQLRDIQAKVKETNKAHFKTLDSLRQAARPRAGADEEAERIRTAMARETAGGVVKQIREAYAAALKEALPILDATQQPKADELLKKQSEEADETLREKMGAAMGGGMRGGRRGRPPGGPTA